MRRSQLVEPFAQFVHVLGRFGAVILSALRDVVDLRWGGARLFFTLAKIGCRAFEARPRAIEWERK
jgi:hypothetical protein